MTRNPWIDWITALLASILMLFGVCGCPPDYLTFAEVANPGYPENVPAYRLPSGDKPTDRDVVLPMPPPNAQATYEEHYPASEGGGLKRKYFRDRAAGLDAMKIAALATADKNLLIYSEVLAAYREERDWLWSKIARYDDLLYRKGQGSLNPGPGTDRLKDTIREVIEELRRTPLPAPGSQPSIQPVPPLTP